MYQVVKELYIMSPPVINEIECFDKIKNLVDSHIHYFFPIISYKIINKQNYKKPFVYVNRVIWDNYTFTSYFYNNRYYVDIIETYKRMLENLDVLHSLGLVYKGFGILKESSINIDKKTKDAFLHNFQYTFDFVMDREKDIRPNMLAGTMDGDIPAYMFIYLYIVKNNLSTFQEKDRRTLLMLSNQIDMTRLVGLSTENVMVELRNHAFYLDICELTEIYLKLCNSIKSSNRHFDKFVDILKSIRGGGGVIVSAKQVLELLDHIVE